MRKVHGQPPHRLFGPCSISLLALTRNRLLVYSFQPIMQEKFQQVGDIVDGRSNSHSHSFCPSTLPAMASTAMCDTRTDRASKFYPKSCIISSLGQPIVVLTDTEFWLNVRPITFVLLLPCRLHRIAACTRPSLLWPSASYVVVPKLPNSTRLAERHTVTACLTADKVRKHRCDPHEYLRFGTKDQACEMPKCLLGSGWIPGQQLTPPHTHTPRFYANTPLVPYTRSPIPLGPA